MMLDNCSSAQRILMSKFFPPLHSVVFLVQCLHEASQGQSKIFGAVILSKEINEIYLCPLCFLSVLFLPMNTVKLICLPASG